jgi:hypothetical protein
MSIRCPKIILVSALLFAALFLAAPPVSSQGERPAGFSPGAIPGSGDFDSTRFQSAIGTDGALGVLAKQNSVIGDPNVSFGFAEKSDEARFLVIGALYSEAIAYLKAGQYEPCAKRLGSIEKEFINLQVPVSLYNYVSKTRNLVELKKLDTATLQDFLSLFQPFFEDYAKGQSADKLTLFRTGTWLVDMGLAASAGNKALLKQTEKIEYFVNEMKRMDAPKGVIESLEAIRQISLKNEITDRDTETVVKMVRKIQTTLG